MRKKDRKSVGGDDHTRNNSNLMRSREHLAIVNVSWNLCIYFHACTDVSKFQKILNFSSSTVFNWVWNRSMWSHMVSFCFFLGNSHPLSPHSSIHSKQNTWKCKTCDRHIRRSKTRQSKYMEQASPEGSTRDYYAISVACRIFFEANHGLQHDQQDAKQRELLCECCSSGMRDSLEDQTTTCRQRWQKRNSSELAPMKFHLRHFTRHLAALLPESTGMMLAHFITLFRVSCRQERSAERRNREKFLILLPFSDCCVFFNFISYFTCAMQSHRQLGRRSSIWFTRSFLCDLSLFADFSSPSSVSRWNTIFCSLRSMHGRIC